MKRIRLPLFSLICFFLSSLPLPAFGQDNAAGLDRMINQIESKFPSLEGYIVDVQGAQLVLDLKLGQDLKPGDHLKVMRLGDEIIHPVTKKKLGRRETDLGRAEVVEVRKDYSIARMDNPGVPVKKGDAVRSFFRKISILVSPVRTPKGSKVDAAELGLEIESRLNEHPRFQVPTFDLRVWARENKVQFNRVPGPEHLLALQSEVDVDYLLMPSVTGAGKQAVMDYRLVSAVDGDVVTQSRLMTDAPVKSARADKSSRRKTQRRAPRSRGVQSDFESGEGGPLEFTTKQEFEFEIVDMDTGDVNGDGKPDYVLISPDRVRFYKFVDQKFRQVSVYRAPQKGSQFISVDVADINGNGRDEIFVTCNVGQRLQSFVLEMVKGKKRFTVIEDEMNLYFRVIKPEKMKPMLLVQEPGHDRPFRPAIFEYGWKGDEYEEIRELELPHIPGRPLVTIYGLTLANITPTKALETIFLDSNYHLRVYSAKGRLLVKSDEYYGHDPRVIDVALKEQIPGIHNSDGDVQAVPYRGRLSASHKGKQRFLLIPHNHRFGGSFVDKMTVVNNSSLVVLGIDREGVHKVFETRKQSGYLAAHGIAPASDPTRKWVHSVHVARLGDLGLGKKISTIFTYSW